jgi:hydrogenase maturation protease
LERTLIAGFGNVYRRDDGVGRAVVNVVREDLGRPALDLQDDGFDDLGHQVDTVILHQIVPELAETLTDYDRVIFVDAHVESLPQPIHEVELEVTLRIPFVAHQFHPSTVLALAQQIHGHAPQGILLSVRGHDFDFGEGLSPQTARLVPDAVRRIHELIDAGEEA